MKTCEKPNNFLINNKICSDKCLNGQFAELNGDGEYVCQSSCNSDHFYYDNNRICLENCTDGYNIENTQKCTINCTELNTDEIEYHFYEPEGENPSYQVKTCVTECPSDKPLLDIDNHCSENCKYDDKYHLSNKCVKKCTEPNNVVDGLECVPKCPSKKFEDEAGKCIDSCNNYNHSSGPSEYKYYYNTDRKCRLNCNENDFISENNECVSSCTNENMPFIYKKKCIEFCPQDQKYFIGN